MSELRIMLVDDEIRYLETTSKLLARMGYSVEIATGGIEALSKMSESAIQVVILDVKMPGMDGHDVFRAIKKGFPLVEIIMLTGHATVSSAIEGLREGAFDYLMKPVDINQLIEKVEEAYKKYKIHQEKINMAMFETSLLTPRDILKKNS